MRGPRSASRADFVAVELKHNVRMTSQVLNPSKVDVVCSECGHLATFDQKTWLATGLPETRLRRIAERHWRTVGVADPPAPRVPLLTPAETFKYSVLLAALVVLAITSIYVEYSD